MRIALFNLLWVLGTGCFVHPADPAGRACDEEHPCAGGRVCVQGLCVPDPFQGLGDGGQRDAGGSDGGRCQSGEACTVGLGSCARQGVWVCEADASYCQGTPGSPSAEVCDGLDNDCDGRADLSAEVPLVTPATNQNTQHFSWIYSPGGYSAVYASDRGGGPSVFFQRYDEALARSGAEVELADPAGKTSTYPVISRLGDGGVAVWKDQTNANVPRILVGRVDLVGNLIPSPLPDGGQGPLRRAFSNQDALGPPHLAVAYDQRFMMVVWVSLQERLTAAVLNADGTVFRNPTVLTPTTLPDGGAPHVQKAHVSPVGDNDFLVGMTTFDDGAPTVTYQRYMETLAAVGAPVVYSASGGLFTTLRSVALPNPDGGRVENSAGAWVHADLSTTLQATPWVGMVSPAIEAGPAIGGSWAIDLVHTGPGLLLSWIEAENGELFAKRLGQPSVLKLTPMSQGTRTYVSGADPAVAVADGGMAAMGYALTRAGLGVSIYGQLFCLP
ncbi:MAG: putative metal-binding motif-containing protein [Myxococcota bacterium]